MSLYRFPPMPSFGIGENTFVTWDDGFTNEDIASIHLAAESRSLQEAVVGGGDVKDDIRISKVTWLNNDQDTDWLYDKLSYIASQLNGQFYRFDLFGFQEDMQYTVYDGEREGHYTWHTDSGVKTGSVRKLTLVIQLSDPSEYEGGDLELLTGVEPMKVDKKKGLVVAFPSYVMHRVTPVTSGVRKTLVVWITGPSFR